MRIVLEEPNKLTAIFVSTLKTIHAGLSKTK